MSEIKKLDDLKTLFPEPAESSSNKKTKLESALDRAYEIRKFEIELYWKRAGYFWGFLVATFTAYFIVKGKDFDKKYELEFLVLCIGLIFSQSWYLVNRGSKYWQENWERIIDAIESKEVLDSPLYSISLVPDKKIGDFMYGFPYSVSRINQIVSLFISLLWLALLAFFFIENIYCIEKCSTQSWQIIILSVITTVIIYSLWSDGQSGKNPSASYQLKHEATPYKNKE